MHNYIDDMCTNCGAILKTSEGLEYEINDDGTACSVVGVGSCVDINVVIPSKHEGLPVTYIGSDAFCSCDSLTTVYYTGTAEEWAEIEIDSYNENLTSATRYYYSETEPTTEGNFWYYNDKGEIVIW